MICTYRQRVVLSGEFLQHNLHLKWLKVKIIDAPKYPGRHDDMYEFIGKHTAGRFHVDRTSQPGYWFEMPLDAAKFKVRFL